MGRGNSLTNHEKGMIDAFEKDGHSQREIAKKINRSRCAVNNYIKNKNKTSQKIPGKPNFCVFSWWPYLFAPKCRSNGNEGIFYIPQCYRTGNSPSDSLVSYPEHLFGMVWTLCRGVVGVFYSPSCQGESKEKQVVRVKSLNQRLNAIKLAVTNNILY